MSGMAEVLSKHQISLAWENGEERGITCLCGLDLPTEPERDEIDMTFLAKHQAEALTAAGFGPANEAKAEALDEAVRRIMGPSDYLTNGGTCRYIAGYLREKARYLRAANG